MSPRGQNCLTENLFFRVLVVVAITKRGLQCPLEVAVMPSCKNKGTYLEDMPVPGIWVWRVRTANEGAVSKTESKKKIPKSKNRTPG